MDYTANQKIDERDIIFEALRDIKNKYSKEWRGGQKEIHFTANGREEVYFPDSRVETCQMIEFLFDLLLPKFDSQMKEAYNKIEPELNKLYTDLDSKKITEDEFSLLKTRLMRKLFQELNLLLARTGYLTKKAKAG